ncbi:hypothetical protein [Rhodoferax sp. PAMC 29310]|uniref:hypothetical protein n=1 Tax=Rhodoferax sp. PAMC 29310 TaxID=2822760 RepID=UPI001B32F7E7|nr:hypothetical protein [Rhodoferax sp. PAMC 29310]
MRNLSIEVRQVSLNDASGTSLSVQGAAQLTPGRSGVQVEIQGNTRQSTQSANSQQQVLVLNGRPAAIALRNSVPMRLVQSVIHNGSMIVVPGVVILESGTGFNALPRWDGRGTVDLTISAMQGQGRYQTQTASTSTMVMVGLGEWVTVAQSEQQSIGTSADGSVDSRQTTGILVQVKVTTR